MGVQLSFSQFDNCSRLTQTPSVSPLSKHQSSLAMFSLMFIL